MRWLDDRLIDFYARLSTLLEACADWCYWRRRAAERRHNRRGGWML